MSQFVSEIISVGGRSLEKEDQFEQWFSGRRGQVGGVLTVKRPCYHQYVFGRAILPKYHAELQFHNEARCFATLQVKFKRKKCFFVMERWNEGESLTPLAESIDNLAEHSANAYLLVFSANPTGQTEEHLRRIDGLPAIGQRTSVHRFLTENEAGEEYEFWIGGWQVASSSRR